MSAAIKCDRCHDLEEATVKQSDIEFRFVSSSGNGERGFSLTTYELCIACTAALQKWIKNK